MEAKINIQKHFNFLLDNYKLRGVYHSFLLFSCFSTLLKESFYWLLLYFSLIVKNKPEKMHFFAKILIMTIGVNVFVTRYFGYYQCELLKKVKLANNDFFNDRIINMTKKNLLNFDLVEYFEILENFNLNIEEYILNVKKLYDIPIKSLTIGVIAISQNYLMLIGLFAVFYAVVRVLNERKLIEERELTKKYFKYEGSIRNYIINGKNLLLNNEFNKKYSMKNYHNFENINAQIFELKNMLELKVDIAMLIFIIIVIVSRINRLTHFGFFSYFLIIYDIEFISDMINDYYKGKVNYNKMEERLRYLYSFIPNEKILKDAPKISRIELREFENEIPKVKLESSLTLNTGDHYLVTGESGSGKTTLLYLFKGILQPSKITVTPTIKEIIPRAYLTLPNHKSVYSGVLNDIISNYELEPNHELIKFAIEKAKIDHKLKENEFIDIDLLSGGERIRLLIARLIYTIKTRDFDLLLFDEIDENLNDVLAVEIYKSLREVFSDKMMLYITHNEKVKQLFEKKIKVGNGEIKIL